MLLQQLIILASTTREKVFSKSLFIHYFYSYHRRPKSKIRLLSQVPDEWRSKQDLETQEHPHVAICCYELSFLQLKYMQHKQNWHFIHRFISPPHYRLEAVLVAEVIFLPPHSSSNRTCLSSLLSTTTAGWQASQGLPKGWAGAPAVRASKNPEQHTPETQR